MDKKVLKHWTQVRLKLHTKCDQINDINCYYGHTLLCYLSYLAAANVINYIVHNFRIFVIS
jgi:hypothetical protein